MNAIDIMLDTIKSLSATDYNRRPDVGGITIRCGTQPIFTGNEIAVMSFLMGILWQLDADTYETYVADAEKVGG